MSADDFAKSKVKIWTDGQIHKSIEVGFLNCSYCRHVLSADHGPTQQVSAGR